LMAIAVGRPVAECAALADVSEATVRRRLRSAKYMAKVREIRRQMTSQASGQLADGLAEATATMRALLKSSNDSVRLGAAKGMVQLSVQLGEMSDLAEKVGKLEQMVAALKGAQDDSNHENG